MENNEEIIEPTEEIKELSDDVMEPIEEEKTGSGKSPKSNSRLVIGLGVVLLLLMCCCVVIAAVVAIDPFDWQLLGFLSGGGDAAVDSMPADTGFYAGLNMDHLTIVELGRVIDPFLEEDLGFDYRNFAELIQDFDDELENLMGFNLSDDLLPWIGPNVGIGLVDYRFDEYGGIDEAQILVVAETKDNQAADDFIAKFIDGAEDASGYSFDETEHEGVTIFVLDSDYEDERVSIARSGDLVYFSTSTAAIEDGIDAKSGDSLADNEEYSKLERVMSSDRAVTLYVSEDFVGDSAGDLAGGYTNALPLDPNDVPVVGETGGALTLTFLESGIQLDVLTTVGVLDEEERLVLEGSNGDTAEMLPEDTFLYITAASISQFWEVVMAVTPDYEEAMQELEDEIGFDIVNDLILHLDGETGIGLWPSSEGALAEAADIAVAFAALAGTSNEEAVSAASGDIVGLLEDQFLTVDSKSSEDITLYVLSEEFSGIEAAYGVADGYFFITSGESAAEEVFDGESSLADSELYKDVWSEFPRGTSPALYLEVDGILGIVDSALGGLMYGDTSEASTVLSPISVIALGGDFGDDVSRATMIVFLNTE